MKSNFVSDKYEIRKIPEFQFKYYKCFGWETVGNATGEPEDYDYEYDTRRLLLSQANPGAPNGLQSIFKDNYEHKIKTDENGQNDRLRLINIRRNRKIAMSDSVSVPYDKYIKDSRVYTRLKKRYKYRVGLIILDILFLILFLVAGFVSLTFTSVEGGLLEGSLPTVIADNLISYMEKDVSSIASMGELFIGISVGCLVFVLAFIVRIRRFCTLRERLLTARDYVLTDLYNGYIAVKKLRLRDPSLQNAHERANFKRGQIFSSAILHAQDLNNTLHI